DAEHGERQGHEPHEKRRIVDLGLGVPVRRHPIAALEHLLGALGVEAIVVVGEMTRADLPEQEEQREQGDQRSGRQPARAERFAIERWGFASLGRGRSAQPSVSSMAAALGERRQVNVGVSRRVYEDASVSRMFMTRSRKSSGRSDSKATTNSWSSRPNE